MPDLDDLFDEASIVGEESEELPWLVISHDFRTISIPSVKLLAGVTSDEKVNRLYFRCPRKYDEVDLNDFNFRINYTNAHSEGDQYLVMDKTATEDEIRFTWLLGRHACAYAGTLSFIVCAVETGAGSVIRREYNTAVHSLNVLQGLETSEETHQAVVDVIDQFQSDFDKIEHLDDYMTEIREDMDQIGDAGDYADDSEAYAIGTRRGTEVESDDPAYENNSKYYSEQAAASESAIRTLMLSSMLVYEDLVSTDIILSADEETRYIYGELYSLMINSLPSTGIVDISFTSGTTPTVLVLPETAIVPEWFDPTDLNADTYYSLSIEDYKVVVSEWPIT